MAENLKYWEKLKRPPEEALSKIKAGRLRGMTDIKPAWRIKAMTEVFGPCGIGWKYSVDKRWVEECSDNQKLAFVDVEVCVLVDGKWSDPIPGNGGSKLVAKESSGMYSSDEAFKMATTDALSSALKMLGVAADIYMGNFDGSKYTVPKTKHKELMTKEQSDRLVSLCKKEHLEPIEVAKQYGITKHMPKDTFDATYKTILSHLESGDLGYKFAVPEGEPTNEDDQ